MFNTTWYINDILSNNVVVCLVVMVIYNNIRMDYVFNMEIPLVISQFCLCQKLHLNCRDGVFIVFLCILPITKYNIIFCTNLQHIFTIV